MHKTAPVAHVDKHVVALSLHLVDHASLNLSVTVFAREPQGVGLAVCRPALDCFTYEVWLEAQCELSDVRADTVQLVAVLSKRCAASLDNEVVRARNLQRGIDERTSFNTISEAPQPLGRGAMIKGHTNDNSEIGDERLLHDVIGGRATR